MSPQEVAKSRTFIEDQLEQTTRDLFNARSVREIQFLQQKLDYLKTKMKETNAASRAAKRPAKKASKKSIKKSAKKPVKTVKKVKTVKSKKAKK